MRKVLDITIGELEGRVTDIQVTGGKMELTMKDKNATFHLHTKAQFVFDFLDRAEEEKNDETK